MVSLEAQHGGGAGTSLAVELRNLEERARRGGNVTCCHVLNIINICDI